MQVDRLSGMFAALSIPRGATWSRGSRWGTRP